jgi:hypothetical protein
VPTADSSPRAITNGSDGNRWFTVAPNGDPWSTMVAANKVATLQLQ